MNGVTELGYLGIEATDIPAWERFALDQLGLQRADGAADGTLALRIDDRAQRIVIEPGPADDMSFAGYDCGSEAALDALVDRLRADGLAVDECSDELAARRRVRRLFATRDPAGNRVELYVDLVHATTPFQSELVPSGFFTADGGLGHTFLPVADRAAVIDFYSRIGFRISDYIREEVAPGMVVDGAFMHCNGRHHTIAFAAFPSPKKLHHLMLQVNDRVDVGCAYDRVLAARTPLSATLGMHPNDLMFSFYVVTPSGFSIEFGSGGRQIEDDATWEVVTYDRLSLWGHKPPAQLVAALS
ncbi:MAG: VOC family protein [Gammaproteobacteria bacterium]